MAETGLYTCPLAHMIYEYRSKLNGGTDREQPNRDIDLHMTYIQNPHICRVRVLYNHRQQRLAYIT